MTKLAYVPNWRDKVVFSNAGPSPQILAEDAKMRLVLAGLQPGQMIPSHPEVQAVFVFLEGTGAMVVDGERLPVGPGSIIVAPQGAQRGVEAETQLVFLATRMP